MAELLAEHARRLDDEPEDLRLEQVDYEEGSHVNHL
jgi:predicted RNA-binding protein YlqC (UPF0109 family)